MKALEPISESFFLWPLEDDIKPLRVMAFDPHRLHTAVVMWIYPKTSLPVRIREKSKCIAMPVATPGNGVLDTILLTEDIFDEAVEGVWWSGAVVELHFLSERPKPMFMVWNVQDGDQAHLVLSDVKREVFIAWLTDAMTRSGYALEMMNAAVPTTLSDRKA